MKKTLCLMSLLSVLSVSAFADDQARRAADRIVELKDGSTLYIFSDAKMAMRDRNGRVARMAPGEVMETAGGEKIVMVGNEVARLDAMVRHGHQGAWSREAR